MTKNDFLELTHDLPGDCEIDIYDCERALHPNFTVNRESYFDYDKGVPIITFECHT